MNAVGKIAFLISVAIFFFFSFAEALLLPALSTISLRSLTGLWELIRIYPVYTGMPNYWHWFLCIGKVCYAYIVFGELLSKLNLSVYWEEYFTRYLALAYRQHMVGMRMWVTNTPTDYICKPYTQVSSTSKHKWIWNWFSKSTHSVFQFIKTLEYLIKKKVRLPFFALLSNATALNSDDVNDDDGTFVLHNQIRCEKKELYFRLPAEASTTR